MGSNDSQEKILREIFNPGDTIKIIRQPLWVGDKDHNTIYINSVFEDVTGYSFSEIIGKKCWDFFDEESAKTIEKHHKLRQKGESSNYNARLIAKNGELIPIMVSGTPTPYGGTFALFSDMRELKKLEQKDKLAQKIIQNTTDAIVLLDNKRRISFWNRGAKRIFGYDTNEVLNKSINILIPPEERANNRYLLQTVRQNHHIENIETTRITKSGEKITVLLTVSKVMGDDNNFIGYLVLYRDITDQKSAKSQLQKRFESIQDAYKELGLQRRYFDYINEIAKAASSLYSVEQLANLIVNAFGFITRADGVILRLYNKKTESLELVSTFGVGPKWLEKTSLKLENSIAYNSFELARPLVIDRIDMFQKHRSQKLLRSHKFQSLVMVPLIFDDEPLGTISLYSIDSSQFRSIETDFLEKLAIHTSVALFSKKSQNRG